MSGALMMSSVEAKQRAYNDPQAAIRYMQLAEAQADAKRKKKLHKKVHSGAIGWSVGAKQPIDVSFKHWPGQHSRAARPKRTQARGEAMMQNSILSKHKKRNAGRRGKQPSATRPAGELGLLEQGVTGPGGQGVMLSADPKLGKVDEFDKGSREWYPDVACPTGAIAGMFGSVCGTGD